MPIYSIFILLLLISSANAQQDHYKWSSPSACVAAHLRLAQGRYPLPQDDTKLLMLHCEHEYKAERCNFLCDVSKVGWEFAISAPQRLRDARILLYFKEAQRRRTSCSIVTRLTKGCPDEGWTIP